MSDFRTVTEDISVAPQIAIEDLAEAARRGFRTIINNRPDGEAPDQPSSAEMEAAAAAEGLAYVHLPVRGVPTPEQVDTTARLMTEAERPVLAFCRSGTRSIVTWALSEAQSGRRSREDLIGLGRQAGYDLTGVLGG